MGCIAQLFVLRRRLKSELWRLATEKALFEIEEFVWSEPWLSASLAQDCGPSVSGSDADGACQFRVVWLVDGEVAVRGLPGFAAGDVCRDAFTESCCGGEVCP
jgi:hypothetical protein